MESMNRPGSVLPWFVWLAGLLALAFWLRAGPLAACVYALALVLAAGRAMTWLWTGPLAVERELSQDVLNLGDSVRVTVRIRNLRWWPVPWLYAEETLPAEFPKQGTTKRLLLLPPRRAFHLTYQLTPTRRGCHQLGPLVVETGDVFGLFKRCRVHPRRDFVTVLPNYQLIEEFEVGRVRRLGNMTARRSLFEDPTRLAGVREYRRGDPLNHIHWRSSARLGALTGQLATRVFEPVTEAGATIVLDFHQRSWAGLRPPRPHWPAEEMAVEVAASLARYLADGGWKVGLLSNGRDPLGLPGVTMAQARATETLGEAQRAAHGGRRDERLAPLVIPARRGPEQFALIHENLGRLALSDGLPLEQALWEDLSHIEREQVLAVIAGRVDDGLIGALLSVRALGYRILLMVVGDNPGHDRALETLVPAGVELMRMDEEWRLREIATGRLYV
jgi:uncharacterized protein (DUF58 family)